MRTALACLSFPLALACLYVFGVVAWETYHYELHQVRPWIETIGYLAVPGVSGIVFLCVGLGMIHRGDPPACPASRGGGGRLTAHLVCC
jgi:hypothetical protein